MYKYFTEDEFVCKETGRNEIKPEFIHRLDELREACGFPFVVTSGYRDPSHSAEAHKPKAGRHAEGIAADIQVSGGSQRYALVCQAMALGFTGIGIAKTFVHVDIRDATPMVWSY